MSTNLYLKYKGDRWIARQLSKAKAKKNDETIADNSENPQEKAQTCKVSLPIQANGRSPVPLRDFSPPPPDLDRYHNYQRRKRAASEKGTMTDEDIILKKKPKLTDVKTSPEHIRPSPEALNSKTAQLQMVRSNKTVLPVSESRSVPGPGELPIVPSNFQENKIKENNPPLTQPDSLDAVIFKKPQSVCPQRKKKLPDSLSQSVPITDELPIEPLNLHQINEKEPKNPNSSGTQELRMVRPQNKLILPVSEGRSLPGVPVGAGKSPTITSNLLINKETKQMEISPPLTKLNCLNAATMISPETISSKHKLPVSPIPAQGNFGAIPIMGMECSATDANKCIRRKAEIFVQTENVFIITEDDSKTLDLITNSGVTKDELTKWLRRRKNESDNKMTTEVIIDVDKYDENKNINQDTLNLALFHSQNNKNRLLSEMAQLNKSNANQSSDNARPPRPGTPYPQLELQNAIEARKSLIQMAFQRFSLANRIDPPVTTADRNTQTEENTNVTQSDLFNRQNSNNNPQQLVTMPNQQTQYDPQAVLMQKGQLTQQMSSMQSGHQQSYPQMQPCMQLQQTEHQQRFQFPQSDHQHRSQLQQVEHQQQTPQIQQHLQSQSSQLRRLLSQNPLQQGLHLQHPQQQSLQHQPPLQFLELQKQKLNQLQSSHSGEHQNESFQQQQIHQTQMPPNMQYASATNYLNQGKPPASKGMIQLFPGDPRYRSLRYQLAASKQAASLMSTHEANMRTAQQPHQNYQQQYQQQYPQQYQQHYQNHNW